MPRQLPDPTIRNADVISIRDDSIPPMYQNMAEEDIVEVQGEPIDAMFEAQSGNMLDDQGLSNGLGNGMFRGRQYVPLSGPRNTASMPASLRRVPTNRRGELLSGIQNQLAGTVSDYITANPGTSLIVAGGVAALVGLLLKRK